MPAAPLVVTSDSALWAQVERAAAAADVAVDRASSAHAAGAWRAAPAVIVDAAQLDEVLAARLPRRDGITVVTTRPMAADQWSSCVRLGVRQVLGPDVSEAELVRVLADAGTEGRGRGDSRVIAVVGACGGAGATVLATAIAVAARRAARPVLLCDLDPSGAGLDIGLGLEDAPGARWGDISASHGSFPADSLFRGLPLVAGKGADVAVLTYRRDGVADVGDVAADDGADLGVAATVLDAVGRAGGLAVVDLPRARLAAVGEVVARADVTVLVTPADVRGCYAAARVVPRLADLGASTALAVRGPSPGGIGARDIAAALHLPLVAAMRPQPALDKALEAGRCAAVSSRGPLRRAANAILRYAGGA
ncbi:MAG: hypothetical protein BGO26_15230 [Actinobacteria bacterium 69-20]|jgi:secretion/DNA translocation related CpaE-like protein|nr:septum formation initiator [Actinomycetota bacterium]OJV29633.1 MAG: hypothetical protein BGO26_15230 [Actinobacteria bacterium 69-20]